MLGLIETDFAPTRKLYPCDGTPPFFVNPRAGDAFFYERSHFVLQIVTHEKKFVRAIFFGWVEGGFRRRQSKYQPAISRINRLEAEHVAQECTVRVSVCGVQNHVNARNHMDLRGKTWELWQASSVVHHSESGQPLGRTSHGDICLWLRGWNEDCSFGAADVFERIVRSDGDGVFARRKSGGDGEFVALFESVADVSNGCDENPVAAVHAVLGAVNAAGRVAREEFDEKGSMLRRARPAACLGSRCFKMLDRGRRIVNQKALAFAFSLQGDCGGIRRGVGDGNFEIVGAVCKRGRVPGIEFLIKLV